MLAAFSTWAGFSGALAPNIDASLPTIALFTFLETLRYRDFDSRHLSRLVNSVIGAN